MFLPDLATREGSNDEGGMEQEREKEIATTLACASPCGKPSHLLAAGGLEHF